MKTVVGRADNPRVFVKGFVTGYYGASVSNIALCLLYGSRKWDLDFLVVLAEKRFVGPRQISADLPGVRLDGTEISLDDFKWRALRLDPAFTEPLITGELLFGSRRTLANLKKKVLQTTATAEIVSYLRHAALKCIFEAIAWLNAAVVRLLELTTEASIGQDISIAQAETYKLDCRL